MLSSCKGKHSKLSNAGTEQRLAMFCLSNLSINKTVTANATLPQKSDSSPQQTNAPPKQPSSLHTTKTITSLPTTRNKLRHRSPHPSVKVIEIERIVGAGSFRDGEPRDSEQRKSVFDLLLGRAFEGPVEKKVRMTGEWLATNTETRFRSAGKGILMFVFQWMLPIWAISLVVASGAIKLPFNSPFLDDLFM